jgi:hypothetical protein
MWLMEILAVMAAPIGAIDLIQIDPAENLRDV